MPNTLDHIYDILIDRILSHCPGFSRSRNMTLAQYKAMTRLKENNSIVIKKADKGSNIVIQNVTDYVQEVKGAITLKPPSNFPHHSSVMLIE